MTDQGKSRTYKTFDRVCCTLRSRIMLQECCADLPKRRVGEKDVDLIKRALSRYLDAWVLPVLDAVQDGRARNPRWERSLSSSGSAPWGARMASIAIPREEDPRLPAARSGANGQGLVG